MAIRTFHLAGSPGHRGRVHGAALGESVRAHVKAWLASLRAAGVGEPQSYVEEFLHGSQYGEAIGDIAPDLLAEVEGISEAAQVPHDVLFALQLMDEEWAFRSRRSATVARDKCSSLAFVMRNGTTLIGQNMDLGGYTDGFQVLLRFAEAGPQPETLVFSTAGMIGLMGVNAAGVGVCVNSLPQLPSRFFGLPVAFVLRALLKSTSLVEASKLVLSIPHATNQHYLIAEAGKIRAFEASASGVTELRLQDDSRAFHTNHPLGPSPAATGSEAYGENSVRRLQSLTARLGEGDRSLQDVKDALSSFDDDRHPVCRVHAKDELGLTAFTTGSMISSLPQDARGVESWVSAGPPVRGYEHFCMSPRQPKIDTAAE